MSFIKILVLSFLFVSFRPSRLFYFRSARFPVLRFRFLYSAFCLFPFILPGFAPTAVPPVLPSCFRLRAFPSLTLPFVRFRSVLTTQPSALSFPFFPFSPVGGSYGAFSSSVRPVSMPSFRFRYSARCISFLRSPARFTAATPAPQPSSFRFPAVPLGFRFRFWLLGFGPASFQMLPIRSRACRSRSELVYNITHLHTCQLLFLSFLKFFPFFISHEKRPRRIASSRSLTIRLGIAVQAIRIPKRPLLHG